MKPMYESNLTKVKLDLRGNLKIRSKHRAHRFGDVEPAAGHKTRPDSGKNGPQL